MQTKIRLARFGAKGKPFYRIVVASVKAARNGRSIETVGHYDPAKGLKSAVVEKDRIQVWLKNGAVPTEAVRHILKAAQATV